MAQLRFIHIPQHWSRHSEEYTGGHSLLSALDHGWRLGQEVTVEEHQLNSRTIRVYRFELTWYQETVIMRVVTNPYVEQLIRDHHLRVIPMKPLHPVAY